MKHLGSSLFFFALFFAASAFAFSADALVADPQERESLFKRAIVWQKPLWMTEDFNFSPGFDIERGPGQTGDLAALHSDELSCEQSEDDQDYRQTGMTPKFTCQLLGVDPVTNLKTPLFTPDGRREKIKVKYTGEDDENPEVYAEVLGTRLLWALGFAADEMYAVEKVYCYGCASDPFTARRLDPSSFQNPRAFIRNAIELKYPGHEIKFSTGSKKKPKLASGWTFADLMSLLPDDAAIRAEAFEQREALKLLSILIQHADNKADNQRAVCPENEIVDGRCVGRPIFFIHDIGASFGVKDDWGKLEYERWIRDPLWSDPQNCIAQFKFAHLPDRSVRKTEITESGRNFLKRLLVGFSDGPAGRSRVSALFRAARLEKRDRPESVEMWTEAFLAKVDEVRFPAGKKDKGFHCPTP